MVNPKTTGARARPLRDAAPNAARLLLVILVAMAIVSALPMSSQTVEAARTAFMFSDGSDTATIEFTTIPSPGERQTVYFKLKPDVEVVSAHVSMTSTMFERYFEAFGSGTLLLAYGIDVSGDLNADGRTDLLLTSPGSNGGNGIVFGLFGRVGGFAFPLNIRIDGTTANDYMGWSISTGGDLNNDKRDDIAVGAIQMDFSDPPSGTGTGKVNLHWGGATVNNTPDMVRSYGSTGDAFGWSVSTIGDVNDDGYADMLVGAPRHVVNDDNPGLAYLYLCGKGGPGTTPNVTLTGADDGDAFGYDVKICGDVDDDGYDDVLVTAPSHNGTSEFDVGKAYLYLGTSTGVSTTASWTYTGGEQGDLFGYSACGLGDVNGDGYDDIAISAPGHDSSTATDAGAVYVFYGHSSGPSTSPDVTIEGPQASGGFGASVANLGDTDADGLPDFGIGAPNIDNGTTMASAGAVYIVFGDTNGPSSTPDIVKYGATADMDFGGKVAPGGDGDGDGFCDVLIGDYTAQGTFVYYGSGSVRDPRVYFDNTEILRLDGGLRGPKESVDFTALVNAYLVEHAAEVDANGDLLIPLNVTFASRGKLLLTDLAVIYFKLNQPQNFVGRALARGNAVELTWAPQTADDTSALSVEMWNGTGWEEVKKVPRLNVSHIVEGLTDGVEYQFRLRAYDGGVQRYSEPTDVVRVTPMDTKAPAKVINVTTKQDQVAKGINVTWDASDHDTVHYEVWSNKSGAWEILANLTAPQNWYLDTDIDDGPNYYYRVRAWDEVPLMGELSNIVKGKLDDTSPPMVPTGLAVTPLPEGNALRITWDLNDDDTLSYSLQSNKTGEWREVARLLRTVGQHVDRGLMDGNTYWYRLYAIDESSNPSANTSPVSGVPQDTTLPAVPQGVQASARSQGNTLRVEWAPNVDDTEFFKVYLYNTSSSRWEMVGMVAASVTQYDAIGLVDGTTYRLRVTAQDEAGLESDPSSEASGVPRDTLFPTIPTGMKITVVPEGKALNLTWAENLDDTVSYKIYRFEEGTWLMVAEVDATTRWFLDTGLTNNVRYPYVITAIDEVGNESPFSTRVEAIAVDSVPPLRPSFTQLPSRTRFKDVTVTGVCEPFAKITLHVNKLAQAPVDCDDLGTFSVDIRLRSGSNEIYAVADDGSGYTTESEHLSIYVDETPPAILSVSPVNGEAQVEREGLTVTLVFREDIAPGDLEMVLVKGKETDMAKLLAKILLGDGVVQCELISYIRTDLRATFNVTQTLDRSSTYTVVVMGVVDVAGNPMETEADLGLWTSVFTTTGGGPVDPTDGDGDGGISSLVLGAVAAVIIIVVVIVVAVFIMRAGARGETVEVERRVIQGPPPEPTAEELRPDVQTLYAEAYGERGEEPQERHEVDAGLGTWLAEQERASQEADEETKRLVAEMAKQPAPPVESGPIEEVPPGLVEHRVTMDEEEAAPEGEAPKGEKPEDGEKADKSD